MHGFGGGYLPPVTPAPGRALPEPGFTLTAGMAVVVQPNVVIRDQTAGVQTGELLLVTEHEPQRLHAYPQACTKRANITSRHNLRLTTARQRWPLHRERYELPQVRLVAGPRTSRSRDDQMTWPSETRPGVRFARQPHCQTRAAPERLVASGEFDQGLAGVNDMGGRFVPVLRIGPCPYRDGYHGQPRGPASTSGLAAAMTRMPAWVMGVC